MQVSDFLDRTCKEEKLVSSFYVFHYVTPANAPVPLTYKVGDLDNYELQLIDKRGNNFFVLFVEFSSCR